MEDPRYLKAGYGKIEKECLLPEHKAWLMQWFLSGHQVADPDYASVDASGRIWHLSIECNRCHRSACITCGEDLFSASQPCVSTTR